MANELRVRTDLKVDGNIEVDGTINGIDTEILSAEFPQSYVKSGKLRNVADSDLPAFLVPNGLNASATVDANVTDLEVVIDGAVVTIANNIVVSGLTLGPSVSNTALVDDADAADQMDTRQWGEEDHRKSIIMDSAAANIVALVGQWAPFRIQGTSTEYFLAYVKSATELTNCKRGYFYDSSITPIIPAAFSDNDVITLMRAAYWFVSDGAAEVTYRTPKYSAIEPSSPSTDDRWFNLATKKWNKYNGSIFVERAETFVGITIQDDTACVAARSKEFFAEYDNENQLDLELIDTEVSRVKNTAGRINVAGVDLDYGLDRLSWDITAHLAPAADMIDATEQADRMYYLYVKKNGAPAISDIAPIYRPEMKGYYSRYNMWRCAGMTYNDGSSDLIQAGPRDLNGRDTVNTEIVLQTTVANNSVDSRVRYDSIVRRNGAAAVFLDDGTLGSRLVIYDPGHYTIESTFRADAAADHGIFRNVATTQSGDTNVVGTTKLAQAKASANQNAPCTATVHLKIGDVVSAQFEAGSTFSAGNEDYITLWLTKAR